MKRANDQIRQIKFTRDFTCYAEGSVLVEFGNTKVLCNATVEEKVPSFLKDTGQGWVTAEYQMLPRATETRTTRAASKGKLDGRSTEIQRLIGRSLRAGIDMMKLGERTVIVDCDVLQADGGTRTAAISGGFVALYDAVRKLVDSGKLKENPIGDFLAAVSVGIVNGDPMVDLCYSQDFKAHVDMNVVMNESGRFVEVQGTAEKNHFSREELDAMLSLAAKGISSIISAQKDALDI